MGSLGVAGFGVAFFDAGVLAGVLGFDGSFTIVATQGIIKDKGQNNCLYKVHTGKVV